MRRRETIIISLLVGVILCLVSVTAQAEGKFKLKPGATGKLCLNCHSAFSEKMKAKHIHTPLVEGD
jgi:hypothetical protein